MDRSKGDVMSIEDIAQYLNKELTRIRQIRRMVRVMTGVVYLFGLSWIGWSLMGSVNGWESLGGMSPNTPMRVVGGFVFFCVVYGILMAELAKQRRSEEGLMRAVVELLFPGAEYDTRGIEKKRVVASRLFGESEQKSRITLTGYGRIRLQEGEASFCMADMGVSAADVRDVSTWNVVKTLYDAWLKPLFGGRMESSMHGFRGLFAYVPTQLRLQGTILLLPDRLDERLGYLAYTVQSLKRSHGARLVKMEDPEFERRFVVYADDEIEARRILTPATMHRLTRLRDTAGHELMLSFTPDAFYYAASMPGGFLRPSSAGLKNADALLRRLHDDVAFCRYLRQQLLESNHH